MKKNYVFLADGFEEIEALATVDVMRRAGMEVVTVSINVTEEVEGAHGVTVKADTTITDIDGADADWLICPGGLPGSQYLAECEPLTAMLKAHAEAGKHVAAICAAPALVLAPLGILNGRKATCYPGLEPACRDFGAEMVDARAVTDGNIVTGNGPSSAIAFALTIVTASLGADKASEIAAGMLV